LTKKTEKAAKEIEKFQTALTTTESKLAMLSTMEDSNICFNKTKALLLDYPGRMRRASIRGKHKEPTQTSDEDMHQQDDGEDIFQDSSPHMEREDTTTTTTITIFQAGDREQTS
jgi:hypothetical protein